MESIEKLRYYIDHGINHRDELVKLTDAIEREIAEKYKLLPVDADGEPIHVGDVVQGLGDGGPVRHLELWDGNWVVVFEYSPGQFTRYSGDGVHHVKPDPLKELLNDHLQEREKIVRKLERSLITLGEAESEEDACDKLFAERIRELLGGDAE